MVRTGKRKMTAASAAVANLRRSLGISQEEAARLLNIAKNTWIRWEHGEMRANDLSLHLLPFLARRECPAPCHEARTHKIDGIFLAPHVAVCKECWLMVQFLAKTTLPKS